MWYEWENMNRKFGHCVLKWRIHNYYVLPMNKTWQILSPEFEVRGFKNTKFIMILTNKEIDGKLYLHFYLENLCSGEANTRIHGTCNFVIPNERKSPIFTEFSSNERRISVKCEKKTDSYDLCISCTLFIRFTDVEEDIKSCTDAGINRLSQDLLTLFESEENCDVILRVMDPVEDYDIAAHKPILYSRNIKLKKMFSLDKARLIFEVDHLGQYDEWQNILKFLYTANLKHVLYPPKETYYDISLKYGIEPIISFYEPDELVVHSTVSSEEYSTTWIIRSFLTTEEVCLEIPQMKIEETNSHLRVKMYPKTFQKENIACICVEIEGEGNVIVFVEISVVNKGKKDCLAVRHGDIQNGQIFKGYCFVEREVLRRYVRNENLILNFKLNFLDINKLDKCEPYSDKSIVKCKLYSSQHNYSALSRDLLSLQNNTDESDKMNIIFERGECFIHRCILSARAKYLYETIERSNIINCQYIRPCILKELMHFLYSGKYNSRNNLDDTLDLYEIADQFRIKSLTSFLLSNLESNENIICHNHLQRMFQFADSKNIPIFYI